MPSVLIVVDRPFRGVLERQFADAVHLARVAELQFGSVTILLTGQGVLLAAARADPTGSHDDRPSGAENLRAALRSGTPVLADARAAERHGVTGELADGVEVAPPRRLADALTTHDHVWYA